jgi:hypothetical protein
MRQTKLLGSNTWVDMQSDALGNTPGGERVSALTDAAGAQVVVVSDDVHLISRPLANHQAAIELGKKVVVEGTGCYKEWFDLKGGGIGTNLFAVFGGSLR